MISLVIYKRCLKSNGRPQSSVFALGLDFLIDGFRRFIMCGDFAFFNRLVDLFSVLKENQLYFSSFCRVQSLKTLYQCYYQEP